MATGTMIDEAARIDVVLAQVERLYRTVTGSEPPPFADGAGTPIPPEKNPGEYLEMQIDRLLRSLGQASDPGSTPLWAPPLSVSENGKELMIQIDVPGVRREDVRLETTGRVLEIVGHRSTPTADNAAATVRHSERPWGAFRRLVLLPADALTDHLSAQMLDGVLTVRVGRTQSQSTTTRHVAVD